MSQEPSLAAQWLLAVFNHNDAEADRLLALALDEREKAQGGVSAAARILGRSRSAKKAISSRENGRKHKAYKPDMETRTLPFILTTK